MDTLDFEDIEKSLAAKLNDEDINAILQCINAKNLKRLKLAGCVNINGWGLYLLRRSSVLAQIDLILIGRHENSDDYEDLDFLLSPEDVLTILETVIEGDGCVLRYVRFPGRWLNIMQTEDEDISEEDEDISERFHNLLDRYHQMLLNSGHRCGKCR